MAAEPPPKHPYKGAYGTTLLSRDKKENREQWGPSGIGNIDVAPTVCTADGRCPYHYQLHDTAREEEGGGGGGGGATSTPIHLLIASYRDRLCPRTVFNAFSRAENPMRIYIRIIEQTEAGSDLIDDAGCWDRYCKDFNKDCEIYKDHVRAVHVDSSKAKGPTDARSKLSAMVNWDYVHRDDPTMLDFQRVEGQDFCMQTDSHMDFSDNYDTELIFMHHRTENDYAVLSTYVAAMDQNNQDIRSPVPNLCMVTFTSTIRNWGTKECRNLVRPKLTNAMWGAGLSFHRCHGEVNVPVDPYLDGVFDGEEGSRGLRFFTHGYDVYTPDRVLVTHDYEGHQHNPVVHTWGRHKNAQEKDEVWRWKEGIERERSKVKTIGTKRVNMLLGIGRAHYSPEEEEEIEQIRGSRFGLGNKRTLEQASKFSGIDLAAKKMVENKCGNLIWVPYDESPGGDHGVGETLKRGLAGILALSSDVESHEKPVPAAAAGSDSAASIRGAAGKVARRDLRPIEVTNPDAGAASDAQQVVVGSKMAGSSYRSVMFFVILVIFGFILARWNVSASKNRRRRKGSSSKQKN